MRSAKMKLVKILAVTLLLTASALWLCRDSLRARYHLRALRHAEQQMFAPRPSTFLHGVADFLLRRPNWQGWDAIRSHHEDALIRMGYFASREFPLTNQHITAVQLLTNAQWRFGSQFSSIMVVTNGQRLSGTSVASNSFVRIIAPAAEIGDWNTLVLELDGGRL
jgi:hypothetical protein